MTIEPSGNRRGDTLPVHHPRRSDIDPKAAKRAERQVGFLFLASALASVAFVVAFFATPIEESMYLPLFGDMNASNLLLGLLMGLALFLIGAAAIHWAKKLMPDVERVEKRKAEASTEDARDELLDAYVRGVDESGVKRRPFIFGEHVHRARPGGSARSRSAARPRSASRKGARDNHVG